MLGYIYVILGTVSALYLSDLVEAWSYPRYHRHYHHHQHYHSHHYPRRYGSYPSHYGGYPSRYGGYRNSIKVIKIETGRRNGITNAETTVGHAKAHSERGGTAHVRVHKHVSVAHALSKDKRHGSISTTHRSGNVIVKRIHHWRKRRAIQYLLYGIKGPNGNIQ